MIQYHRSAFGLNLLTRIHGSAVFRGAFMGFLSVIFLLIMRETWEPSSRVTSSEINHPYAVGVLVATLTFLLVFRAQSAYARYWEACTSVYHMVRQRCLFDESFEFCLGSIRVFCVQFDRSLLTEIVLPYPCHETDE